MIDPVSVTFNKSTNNFNIPFAVIAPKKKKKDLKDLKKDLRFNLNNDDPYSNVIGIQQEALFTQDNILYFNKLLDEWADEIVRLEEKQELFDDEQRKRYAKQEYFDAKKEMKEENEIDRIKREKSQLEREKQTKKHIDKYTKLYINTMNKKIVGEVLPKGLYDKGLMVELSYAIQHAQTKEHIEDANSEFMTQLQNQNLEFSPYLSNRNSAVIHDPVSGKFYVAYHGANGIEGVDKQNIRDVINGNYSKNAEFLESENQLKQLLSYLESSGVNVGKDVHLVGYSLGGSKSLMLAEKYNLEGTHYNPFINPLIQHEMADVPKEMMKPQTMARIITDPTTIQSLQPPLHAHNRKYKHILPLAENKTHLDSHGLDQITKKKPRSVDHIVDGKRNIKGEAINHVGTVAGAVAGGYLGYKEGKDNSGEVSEEVYRGILGAGESTLPIIGETDLVESGIVGFTHDEIKHSFNWFENLFRKKKKEEDETPEGYFKAFEDGVNVDIEVDDMVDDVEDSYYI
jgi:predicted esterase YcpF (UPF0227 family)